MATTYTALAEAIELILGEDVLSSADELTVSMPVKYWRNVDGTRTYNTASVAVTFAADALLITIDDAITDAIVAYASSEYGWTVPRTQCLFPQMRRGPVI
jgi:hypothetical protein